MRTISYTYIVIYNALYKRISLWIFFLFTHPRPHLSNQILRKVRGRRVTAARSADRVGDRAAVAVAATGDDFGVYTRDGTVVGWLVCVCTP